ncbi:hypothetical protein [Streptomyces anthocyanicus]|uniref:hypothetical protein n=1 Tax=Streptomyces anthocyanicus TaxID=68174 RepID=UPI0036560B26
MANKRSAGAQRKGTALTSATKRAVTSPKRVQKDAKSTVKPAENLTRAARNPGKRDEGTRKSGEGTRKHQGAMNVGAQLLVTADPTTRNKPKEKTLKRATVNKPQKKTAERPKGAGSGAKTVKQKVNGRWVVVERKMTSRRSPRSETAVADTVFRPMTRKQALQVSEAMRDLPSTKLPPRL